jgi:TRAP-type C4-dicarboxylate transport system permease small subunit
VALGWEDEVVELAFAWMVFLGSAAVWRSGEHIVIDFVPQALAGSGAGRALEVVVGALVLGFLGVFTWYGWLLTLQSHGNTSPMLVLPRPLWYAAVPAGAVMIGYTVVRIAVKRPTSQWSIGSEILRRSRSARIARASGGRKVYSTRQL